MLAVSGWLGLSEAKPRSSRLCLTTPPGVVPMRSGLRQSHPKEGEDSPRRAAQDAEKKEGFRGQEWKLAAFPNPCAFLWVAGSERSEGPVF